jgi:hypothetical protein
VSGCLRQCGLFAAYSLAASQLFLLPLTARTALRPPLGPVVAAVSGAAYLSIYLAGLWVIVESGGLAGSPRDFASRLRWAIVLLLAAPIVEAPLEYYASGLGAAAALLLSLAAYAVIVARLHPEGGLHGALVSLACLAVYEATLKVSHKLTAIAAAKGVPLYLSLWSLWASSDLARLGLEGGWSLVDTALVAALAYIASKLK